MGGEEAREIEVSISKVRRVAIVVRTLCFILLIMLAIAWIALLFVAGNNLFTPRVEDGNFQAFVYIILHGLNIGTLLVVIFKIFSSVASGESPFTRKQVLLFRVAGFLFLSFAAIEAILSSGFSYGFQLFGAEMIVNGNLGLQSGTTNINLMPLLFSIIFFGLSMMFHHGTLLQRLTDETG